MNPPALAPVLPPVLPSPAPTASTPSPVPAPGAFARELKSASQPQPGTDGSSPGQDASTPDRTQGAAEGDAPSTAEAGSGSTARTASQRTTLERWLAIARSGAGEAAAGADTDPDAVAAAAATGRPDAFADEEAAGSDPAALLAAWLPRAQHEHAAANSSTDHTAADAAGDGPERTGPEALPAAVLAARKLATDRGADEAAGRSAVKADGLAIGDRPDRPDGIAGLRVVLAEDRSGTPGGPSAAASAPSTPLPGFAAELARAGQSVGAAGPAAAPPPAAELSLRTPVNDPGFVPRLSGELAVLARNGVQEARVQLHPAELGPIAVQITLDGNAAQVRLAVDNALTRELLEQGMPSLAAALRENGLTLTGGGVFQQPRGQGRDGQPADAAPDRSAGRDSEPEPLAAAAAPRRLRHPGQVDVFA